MIKTEAGMKGEIKRGRIWKKVRAFGWGEGRGRGI